MGLHLDSVGRAHNGRAVKLLIADQGSSPRVGSGPLLVAAG